MHILLAEAVPEVGTIERLFDKYGLLGVLVGTIIYILLKHGPRLIDSQVKLTDTASDHIVVNAAHQESIAKSMGVIADVVKKRDDTISELHAAITKKMDPRGDRMYENHIFSNVKTHRALQVLGHIILSTTEGMPQAVVDRAKGYLAALEKIFESSDIHIHKQS